MTHELSSIDIKRKDMGTLFGLEWLNDEVMNCYQSLLQARSEPFRVQV